jgi:hypothetical protein
MKYYLGPHVWDTSTPLSFWRAPTGCLHHIDLRAIPHMSVAGGSPAGVGLFGMPNAAPMSSDYRLFGQGPGLTQITPVEADRSVFSSMVGVPSVDGTSLAEWVYTLLTLYSDVRGDTAVRPLMPSSGGRMGACGIVRQFDATAPHCAKVLQALRQQYRQAAQAAANGLMLDQFGRPDPQKHRKILGDMLRRYRGTNESAIIPADMPQVAALEPETSISDNFNRANSTGLGTAAGGWSWAAINTGSCNIVSNQAVIQNAPGYGSQRAETDLSSSDHYAEISIVSSNIGSNYMGPSARFSASVQTFYAEAYSYAAGGGVAMYMFKWVTGTATALGSAATITTAVPELYRTECNGSVITGYQAGVSRLVRTDTSITGNTRTGFTGDKSGSSEIVDDFSAADLAAASGAGPLIGGAVLEGGALIRGRLVL